MREDEEDGKLYGKVSYHHYHLCVTCAVFEAEKNIHHKHGSEKAYSKLNLIKHSALRNLLRFAAKEKQKSFGVCGGSGGGEGVNEATKLCFNVPVMISSFSN